MVDVIWKYVDFYYIMGSNYEEKQNELKRAIDLLETEKTAISKRRKG